MTRPGPGLVLIEKVHLFCDWRDWPVPSGCLVSRAELTIHAGQGRVPWAERPTLPPGVGTMRWQAIVVSWLLFRQVNPQLRALRALLMATAENSS
jgi:hypothetical protein